MVDTRSRMVEAAIEALRTRGVAGMSFTEVLRDSGAARGAIYHHFPAGKSELVAAAARLDGERVRDHLAALPTEAPASVVEAFLVAVRPVVEASAAGSGCAVAAVTVSPDSAELHTVAREAFASWTEALAERLAAAGLPSGQAADLASALIAVLEGAHVLCRAAGEAAPFDRAARAVSRLAVGLD